MACTENGTRWIAVDERNEPGSDFALGPTYRHEGCYNGQTSWPKHIVPDYRPGNHVAAPASLRSENLLPARFVIIGQHVSCNRKPCSGGAVFGRQTLRRADRRLDRICQ